MHVSGVLVDRFEIEALAGSGGMGEVYRAKDRHTGQRVAVKVLRGQHDEDAARFSREAKILAELEHPHIVRYVAHGLAAGADPWLAMEWLEGKDLSTRLSEGALGTAEAMRLAILVAEALGHAHMRGIVHRDLKPSNVFLVGNDVSQVKLLDFGIARRSTATRVTHTGMLMGTPGYMAPEQANGFEMLDSRADVFSLGCLLFECLAGEPLFSGSNLMALLTKILFEEPPRLKEKVPDAPDELDELVASMLAKNVQERPPHGSAVATRLRALGDMQTLGMRGRTTTSNTRLLTRSEQRAIAIILLGQAAHQQDVGTQETLHISVERHLRDTAERYGGHYEPLMHESAAILLGGVSLATDLAAQAARCALALHEQAPDRPIVLALGRGEVTGQLPMGHAIERAAKLLDAPGSSSAARVKLDDVVAGLLDARFDVREDDGGFFLLGERALADGTKTLLGKATPCVGRERDLQHLEDLFDECIEEGAARVVLVTAPAGVGKSRLAHEFLRHVNEHAERAAIWVARGDSLRAGSAFGLLGQALRCACGVNESEPLDVRRDKLLGCVQARIAPDEHASVAAFLGEIMGVPFPEEGNVPLSVARRDAQIMADQTRAAFVQFLGAECDRQPVVMVLEDLHWGDLPTVQFVDTALRELRDKPLFVLALARPEVRELFPNLWAKRDLHDVHLRMLGKKAIERLARHVLGNAANAEIVERIAQLSEGNAFYLEELLRHAAEGRGSDLPETVIAMVQSRLSAQDELSRRFLRAASIFGEAFWPGGVSALDGSARKTIVHEALRRLVDGELLVKRKTSRFPDEEEYAFRHALLREGAYAMLTERDRVLGHGLAAEWLEQHGEDDPLVLAEHFEKSGDGTRAANQYRRAAIRANLGGDSARAISLAERGLQGPLSEDLRLVLLGQFCEAHVYRIEKAAVALPRAKELLGIAERGSLPWAQALLIVLVGSLQIGAMDDFTAAMQEAMVAEVKQEAVDATSLLLGMATVIVDYMGNIPQGDALRARLEAVVRPEAEHVPSAAIFCELIVAARDMHAHEDPWTALVAARRALAAARASGHGRYASAAQMLIATNAVMLGAYEEAARAADESSLSDAEYGLASAMRPFALGTMFMDTGTLDKARELAEQLIASGKARVLPHDEARGHWLLAEVLRRMGMLDAAEVEVQTALAMLRLVCPLDLPGALGTHAALLLAQGRIQEALDTATEGLSKYEAMGGCGMFRGAFLRLVQAECLEASGRHDDARAAIGKAWQNIEANAEKIPDAEYRRSFLEMVSENRRTRQLAESWLGM